MPATAILTLMGAVLVAGALPTRGAAQQPGTTLVVVVSSAGSGGALRGAQVSLGGIGVGGVTDEWGGLQLSVPAGTHALEVRHAGFSPHQQRVRISAGETQQVAVELAMRAVAVPEVRVRARAGVRNLTSRGFYTRKEHNPGHFITREDIERQRPHRLSEMLRATPGIRISPSRFSDSRASSSRSTAGSVRCPIQYFLDGVPTNGMNIDDIPPYDVEAMEVYSSASQIPPQFNRRTAMCGVIVIWTRID